MPDELIFEGRLLMNRQVNGPTHARTGPIINGRDVITEIDVFLWGDVPFWRRDGAANVKVYLGIEPHRCARPLNTEESYGDYFGWHGIEDPYGVTTDELPIIHVGDVDLLEKLDEYDGRHVLLIVEKL